MHALHLAAFAVVDELREDAGFLPHLSLVAVDADDVVGHALATRGWLEPLGSPTLGLGPLGVRPDVHGRGIGTVLVHALLALAEACEEPLVALLGSPGYYRRFGFVRSTELGITPPDPACGEYFRARRPVPGTATGTFRYAEPSGRR